MFQHARRARCEEFTAPVPLWQGDRLTFKYFPLLAINASHYETSPAHLAPKSNKTNHRRHLQAALDPGVLCALNLKRRGNAPAKCADKVLVGFSSQWRLDKSVWRGQDYSDLQEQHVLWIYCMLRPGFFVSGPPTTSKSPCFGGSCSFLHGKRHLDVKNCVMQHRAQSVDCCIQFFPLQSIRKREKEAPRGRALPPSTTCLWMEVILSLVILYAKGCNHRTGAVQCVKVAAVLWTETIITVSRLPAEPWCLWPDVT